MRTKTIFLLFVLIGFNFSVFSQFSVGIKSNPIFYNMSKVLGNYGNKTLGTTEKDYDGLWALPNLGISFGYELHKNWELKTEFLYKYQGISQHKEPFENISISYLEIPVLLKWKTQSKIGWFLNGGILTKIKIDAKNSYHLSDEEGRITTNVKEIFNPFVLALNLGGGISYWISDRFYLTGEMRWSYDVTQVAQRSNSIRFKSGNEWYFKNTHILHTGILIGINYQFKQTN